MNKHNFDYIQLHFSMNLILIQFLTFFYLVLSLDTELPELRTFPYIENAVGVHNFTLTEKTPPTIHITTLYILLNKGKEDPTIIGNGCPDNSSICGITKVDLNNGEDPIITGIFSVDKNYTSIDSSPYGIEIYWEKQAWGDLVADVRLRMECFYDDSSDGTESLRWHGGYAGLHDHYNRIKWSSKSFCTTTTNDGGNQGWGFFSTLFLVLIIALAGYLITQAWFKTSTMGYSIGFFNKLVNTVFENFRKIPQCIGEVIEKISGGGNNRGGYGTI